jgi:hypothetical protein
MEWWREARFGMFIHWRVYSVLAGFYHGEPVHVGYYLGHPIPCAGEWIMNVGKIPMAEYQTYGQLHCCHEASERRLAAAQSKVPYAQAGDKLTV